MRAPELALASELSAKPERRRHAAHSRTLTAAMLLGAVVACKGGDIFGSLTPHFSPPPPPPLESVPFGLLGSGKIAFERLGQGYQADYIIDAAAMTSTHIFDNQIAEGPALSPDGLQLAYLAFTDGTEYDVYAARIDGTDVR